MGDPFVGLQARLMSQAMRQTFRRHFKVEYVRDFTNQLREKIGVMFGNPGDDAGRARAQFYASRAD